MKAVEVGVPFRARYDRHRRRDSAPVPPGPRRCGLCFSAGVLYDERIVGHLRCFTSTYRRWLTFLTMLTMPSRTSIFKDIASVTYFIMFNFRGFQHL
ncbi:hypothetical protein EVAR_44494_1 [Eumeta japonica]|uniref:Uncharacterized protein n=1 Tax=Eumeta variegata TaxID=151549 RepID=A0A4C1WJC5_EUMVA|nr:hypothetical protein EVAR_44494_1 [Eumeta japonica]